MHDFTLQVLISCMHQTDHSIISKSNIQSDAIVINQCDKNLIEEYSFKNKTGKECHVKFISTTERGLSRSRNMAIRNATADICLICDDDEVLDDNYPAKIIEAFTINSRASILTFHLHYYQQKYYPPKEINVGYLQALKIASWQIAFKRCDITENFILFDEDFGSGVSKAGGEEVMFLYSCLRNKLKIRYVPINIGKLHEGESQWFHGFTEEYFFDRGIFTRKLLGRALAILYGGYFLLKKRPLYINDISLKKASNALYKGLFK